jgi:predicted methyltransferase
VWRSIAFRSSHPATGVHRRLLAGVLAIVCLTTVRAADDAAETGRLFERLDLKPGMTVAEIGGGSGSMTVEMARRLGPEGKVYSSELSDKSREDIRKAAQQAQLANVIVLESSQATANLPEGCCDAIFMRNVYHHFTQPADMDRSLVAALKPGGRIGVIDFEPSAGSKVPDGVPSNRGGHGIHPATVIDELSSAGMTSAGPQIAWPEVDRKAGSEQFLVLFRKPI